MINRALIKQVVVFGIVGIFATLTHYLVALAITQFNIANLYLANLIGYCCAVSVSYFGHGKLTFKVQLNHALLVKFIAVSIATFLLSELLLIALEKWTFLAYQYSLATVVVTIPIISFVVNKFWVFTHPKQSIQ